MKNEAIEVQIDDRGIFWNIVQPSELPILGPLDEMQQCFCSFSLSVDGMTFRSEDMHAVPVKQLPTHGTVLACYKIDGLLISHLVELSQELPLLSQSLEIEVTDNKEHLLTAVDFYLPVMPSQITQNGLVHAPGQVIPIGTPYAEIAAILPDDTPEPMPGMFGGWLQPGVDETSGLVAFEGSGTIASIWLWSELAPVFPRLEGDGTSLVVKHSHRIGARLASGDKLNSPGQSILVTHGESLDTHLNLFRAICYREIDGNAAVVKYPGALVQNADPRPITGARVKTPEDPPQWLRHDTLALLQINPRPISLWTERLAELARIGFNVIYIMPVWICQNGAVYALEDHFTIDPTVGSPDELRAFVDKAHDLGIRVLFDFIPQGTGDGSALTAKHPEWLVRDLQNRPFGSHGWGPKPGEPPNGHTYSLDWGNPEVRQFMVDWALWNVETFGIDGFRTDAMHWKEPNFAKGNPRAPYETSFGGVKLAGDVRDAIRAINPDFLMLSEVWGPILQQSHDASYENGWVLETVNRAWLQDTPVFTGDQWRQYLRYTRLARPAGYVRVNFTANHDMPDLAKLSGTSPLGEAVNFIHVFSEGIPFVCWLEIDGRQEFYRDILAARSSLHGFTCDYSAAILSGLGAEHVWSAYWIRPDSLPRLVLSNLSHHSASISVTLPTPCKAVIAEYSNAGADLSVSDSILVADLKPGAYVLAAVR